MSIAVKKKRGGGNGKECSLVIYELLRGVWGSSVSDVFAVGKEGTILHYGGNTWSETSNGTKAQLNSVWGSSESDVFTVGYMK